MEEVKDGHFTGAKHGFIQTYMHKRVDPLNLSVDDICIEDIAHALALQCRFTGHTTVPLSVAQHSILVSKLSNSKLWGLLHDASEAYLTDLAAPVKQRETFWSYRLIEEEIMKKVAEKFNLLWPIPTDVHHADKQALSIEANHLMGDVKDWNLEPMPYDYANGYFKVLNWREAEWQFLTTYWSLTK